MTETKAQGERGGRISEALLGLADAEAGRPAADVLGSIPWDGPPLDPDVASAADFLSLL